jgi:hypothetical protein
MIYPAAFVLVAQGDLPVEEPPPAPGAQGGSRDPSHCSIPLTPPTSPEQPCSGTETHTQTHARTHTHTITRRCSHILYTHAHVRLNRHRAHTQTPTHSHTRKHARTHTHTHTNTPCHHQKLQKFTLNNCVPGTTNIISESALFTQQNNSILQSMTQLQMQYNP